MAVQSETTGDTPDPGPDDVGEDNGLSPEEKQFSIVGTKSDNRLRVHSEIASVSRRLLNMDGIRVEKTRTQDGQVVAVTATLPVNQVAILSDGRESDDWRHVVSREVLR